MNRNFENKLLKENIYYFLQNQEQNEQDLLDEISLNNIKQYIKKKYFNIWFSWNSCYNC